MKHEVDISAAIAATKEKKVLNKPFRTPSGPKKFAVYVKNDKGNIVKVTFGDPNMEIKRDNPERQKSYRARHHCETPGPKWKANYWSCKMWSSKPVSQITSAASETQNYMFFGNLKTIKHAIDSILAMNEQSVDAAISDGHDWANDHMTEARTQIEQVYHFLSNKFSGDAVASSNEPHTATPVKRDVTGLNDEHNKLARVNPPTDPSVQEVPLRLKGLSDYYYEQPVLVDPNEDWDGYTWYSEDDILKSMPDLRNVEPCYDDEIAYHSGKEYPYDAKVNPLREGELKDRF
jgi:hypothetical protein